MTRSIALLAAAVVFIAAARADIVAQQTTPGVVAQTPQAFTFTGQVALWTMAIKADKTADFEAVMTKLRDGLTRSAKPERRQQAAGWRVVKVSTPMPDGTIAYVHVISPVVPGADYTIMQILYDEFPMERQALYDQYRGAFARNLSLSSGPIAVDLSKTP